MSTTVIRRPLPSQRRPQGRSGLIGVILFIALLHVAGWGALVAVVAPGRWNVGAGVFGVGLSAYLLGVRHAFDADHIVAIDNTTRKLMREGRRPVSVGFWFSFGHSSVVFALTLFLAFGIRAVALPVLNENSELHSVARQIGAVVSGGFLYVIAALNVVILADAWRFFRRARTGRYDEAAFEKHLGNRGVVNRLLGRLMKLVDEPWQMYLVGLLFGLGFDTATEVALLAMAGSGATSGLPWFAILCLPILFAAGMSLCDTLDGAFMRVAYGWGLASPERKIGYNLVITGLSVATALMIGTIQVVGLLSERSNLRGPLWRWAAALDLTRAGFVIVGVFLAFWIFAMAVRRSRRA